MSFVLSKILWMFLSPGNALVLLLVLGAFLAVAQRDTWRVLGRRICFAVALVFFLIAIFPVGAWLSLPLENLFPPVRPDHVDGIVLLGQDENPELTETRGEPSAETSAGDYLLFASLARQYPQAKLVYTGGSGLITPDSDLSNAAVTREALASIGVPVDRMVFEGKSRTTYENAVYSAAIVHPLKQQKWLLVTSALHMPRSIASFRKAGWTVFAAPTDYVTDGVFSTRLNFMFATHLLQMDHALHEYVGLAIYRMMGRTDQLWPK